MEFMDKDMGRQCSKDELLNRLTIFSHDVTSRLEVRPTIDYLRKVLEDYDKKIDLIEAHLQEQMTRLDNEQEAQNMEIEKLNKELSRTNIEVDMRITKKEGQRIWQHFDRFAEYSDLKDLYAKCIPELAKFEQKIIDYEGELRKLELIIRKFDETLSIKCNKTVVDKLYEYIANTFATKAVHFQLAEESRKADQEQQKNLDHQAKLLEFLKSTIYDKI